MVEAPAVLQPDQGSVSCVHARVPSDVESYVREAPKAGLQTGGCLDYRPLAH